MKAENSLRGMLCPNFRTHAGLLILFMLMLNCCMNRQALAQAGQHLRGTVVSMADGQLLKGATVKIYNELLTVQTDENGRLPVHQQTGRVFLSSHMLGLK
jgi:hypothetical protein